MLRTEREQPGKNIDMRDNEYYVQRMADVLFCWSIGFMGGSSKR